MILSFKDLASEHIAIGVNSKQARHKLPLTLHSAARRKLAALNVAKSLGVIAAVGGSCFEKLTGNRKGQYSIRINRQYRICFDWRDNNVHQVEIVDYH